jgi:PAS domain S-box-containing protein
MTQAADELAEQRRINAALEQSLSTRKRAEAALRASAELYRQVDERSPIGLALVALDGTFIRVNPALCALTGYSNDELLESSYQHLLYPQDAPAAAAYMAETRNGGVAYRELETRYVHRDKHVVWSLTAATLVRDAAGEALYFIVQIQDTSSRKLAEAAMREAQQALASTEAKSRFLATMSHEIRTPMNAIIGMMELLSLSTLNAEQLECVRVVQDSSESLLRVLNDILDYSKIEAGKLNLESVDFDLASQLASIVSLLGPEFKSKGVSLSTHVDTDIPAVVRGDPLRIRQILTNLVGNALKFTPSRGSVRVLVSVELRSGKALTVRFAIEDTGVGIPLALRDRLFVPFSQIDDSTTRKHGGTGLGLAICKQLVDLMGGRIGVASAASGGSSFWFTIPLQEGTAIAKVPEPTRELGEVRSVATPRPEKLLLAEDNEVNALLAVKQFKRLGFDVTVVVNGEEAVKAAATGRFDIIFMDCFMPVMDGLDATRQIRAQAASGQRRVPIVAMTANAQAEDRRECIAAGMDDYIAKPSSLAALRRVLAYWLPSAKHSS